MTHMSVSRRFTGKEIPERLFSGIIPIMELGNPEEGTAGGIQID